MTQQSINALDRRSYSPQNDTIHNAILASTEQTIGITDIISEGPIDGRVNGTASVFLNGDPLESDVAAVYMDPATEITLDEGSDQVVVSTNGAIFSAVTNEYSKRFLQVFDIRTIKLGYIFNASDITANGESYTIRTLGDTAWHNIGAGALKSAGNFVVDKIYTIVSGTGFTSIGAENDNPGTEFKATGVGSGNGTAYELSLIHI